MSRCAGAGREHSQADSRADQWKYSITWTSCSVYEWGWQGGRKLSFFLFFYEFESSLVWEFKLFWEFIFGGEFAKFSKIHEFDAP